MSTNKNKPLVFPSIKLGTLADNNPTAATPPPEPAEAPAETQAGAPAPPVAEPADKSFGQATDVARRPPPQAPAAPAPTAVAPTRDEGVLTLNTPATPLQRLAAPKAEPYRLPFIVAVIASLTWVAGLAAFVFGYQGRSGPLESDAFGLAILAGLAVAPLGFFWAAALAVRQAHGLGVEARRAKQLTDLMIGPAATAAAQAGTIVEAVRVQVDAATRAALDACEQLASLREILASETQQLAEAANSAHRTAVALTDGLSKERNQMNTLAVMLDARAAAVHDAINRQVALVTESADLAETNIREAEAFLTGRTADLAAAAIEAVEVSRTAGDDLARQIARLETAGIGVGDQLRALEDGLTHQRASLVTVAHALRADQEDFAALTESRTAQLSTFLAGANRDVASLNEVTTVGAQALSDLIEAAAQKFHDLADAATHERDLFSASALSSLNALSEAGTREREALEGQMRQTIEALSSAAVEAREAADVHAEAARARVEQLNEAAFAAGQKADTVFEARLSEARGLIEQSAKLVEEAGAKTALKLDEGVHEARTALDALGVVIDDISAKTARLPQEAEARADEVRAALTKGMDDLLATARKAAEETQAIDAAFQDRVKRNYEMLSEAVQLMGVVAQGGQGADALRRTAMPRASRAPTPSGAASSGEFAPIPEPGAETDEAGTPTRLKLTPTASDEEFKAVFDKAGGAPAGGAESGWTWKELLTSIDGDAAGEDAELGRALFRDIEAMGIDPVALLSRGRVDEIAAAIQVEDAGGAREVVRTLAPAAVRRLSRRLISDVPFRGRAQTFVERYAAIVAEAMRRDRGGFQAAALLASDAGRAYLLLDAAAGDNA
jgi:hypothetical protein